MSRSRPEASRRLPCSSTVPRKPVVTWPGWSAAAHCSSTRSRAKSRANRAKSSSRAASACSCRRSSRPSGRAKPPTTPATGCTALPPNRASMSWPSRRSRATCAASSGSWRARPTTLRTRRSQSGPRTKSGAARKKKWRSLSGMWASTRQSSRSRRPAGGGSTAKQPSTARAAARWCIHGQTPQMRLTMRGSSSAGRPMTNCSKPRRLVISTRASFTAPAASRWMWIRA